jgi:hypothetical protein
LLRVRFAYADITNGRTTLRIGQFWSPLFGEVPVSLSHIAFPLGYGAAGMVGWRFPGIFLYHDLAPGKPLAIQLQLAALEGSGPDVGGGIGSGEASGMPQLEARLNFGKRNPNLSWSAYVVGHIDWKDTTAVGVAGNNLTGTAVEIGANVTAGKATVHGNFYTSRSRATSRAGVRGCRADTKSTHIGASGRSTASTIPMRPIPRGFLRERGSPASRTRMSPACCGSVPAATPSGLSTSGRTPHGTTARGKRRRSR